MVLKQLTVEARYCFGEQPLQINNLAPVNFIFAPNGSGKTTISKALSQQPDELVDRAKWDTAPTELTIRVFNEAYRDKVLVEHVAGIFTIGKLSDEVHKEIAVLTKRVDELLDKQKASEKALGTEDPEHPSGLYKALEDERTRYSGAIYDQYMEVDEAVRALVFSGPRRQRKPFFREALERYDQAKSAHSGASWEDLENRADTLSGEYSERELLPTITRTSVITADESAAIARERQQHGTGEFARLVEELKNHDWVSEGRDYLSKTDHLCPFCQQETPKDLLDRLSEYFKQGYDEEKDRMTAIKNDVEKRVRELVREIDDVENAVSRDEAVETEPFTHAIGNLRQGLTLLVERINKKIAQPTSGIDVPDLSVQLNELTDLISDENRAIAIHNGLVTNAKEEKKRLVDDGWSLFLQQPAVERVLKEFRKSEAKTTAKIEDYKTEIKEYEQDVQALRDQISSKAATISNTSEVADKLNKLFKVMGFDRFSLQCTDTVAGGYQIVRRDGTPAVESLSEGEKSFIAFSYYWESLHGSLEQGERPEKVIAVIDDPISSLDSDSLFMVAALIRDAAHKIRRNPDATEIRQMIVLTHNTQFHIEAAYTGNRPVNGQRYFRLTKGPDGNSVLLEDGTESKVKGTYRLLWDAIVQAAGNAGDDSVTVNVGIMNIARRIVEGYFRTVGGQPKGSTIEGLTPVDAKVLGLFDIWANAGSHTIIDDVDQTMGLDSTRQFLKLFRQYFDIVDHSAHFEMMVEACGGDALLEEGGIFASQAT